MSFFSLINIRSFFLALVPVLGIYTILPGVSLDIIVLSVLLLLGVVLEKEFTLNYKILVFFLIIISLNIFSYVYSSHQIKSIFINNTIQIVIFGLLMSYYASKKVNDVFINTLNYVGVFASLFVYFQFVSFWVLSKPVTLFLPFNIDVDGFSDIVSITYGRPNSIFLEPAHYAIFILPVFLNSLIKKSYILSVIYFCGLIISTSTTGFAIAILLLLYHLVFEKRSVLIIAAVAVLIIPVLFFADSLSFIFDSNIEKLGSSSMSENSRFLGAFPLISKMDPFSFVFGLGHNQMSNFYMRQGLDVSNYSNSYLMSLFSFGIIAVVTFGVFLISLFNKNPSKGYFVIFLLILSTDQILFNRNFFYLLSCIYFLQNGFIGDNSSNTTEVDI